MKEKMITRTVTKTTVGALTINTETQEVIVKVYTIGGKYKQEELLSKIQKLFDTESIKHVAIKNVYEEDVLLGMTESKFIENAIILPPRTKSEEKENE